MSLEGDSEMNPSATIQKRMRSPFPKKSRILVESILELADVSVTGERAWDIRIHNQEFFHRVLRCGSVGFGEAYMDGWWDCANLDQLFCKLMRANLQKKIRGNWKLLIQTLIQAIPYPRGRTRAFEVGKKHYDIGNDLFEAMLDESMMYSCGYWKNAANLSEAQKSKLKVTCDKLQLQRGMKVLDIGCGWGGFEKFAAENYGVSILGVTVSEEQAKYAKEFCKGLPVEFQYMDYRDVEGKFDRVVSIGMFEHLEYRNYRKFMEKVHGLLDESGLLLLQTIGKFITEPLDPWILKYIFPNSNIPTIKQIGTSLEGLFVMEDWHNFGSDYDKTLMAWFGNFDAHWEELKSRYDEKFHRMWKYYLLSCAGAFRARDIQLWQIVLAKNGALGGYSSIR